MAHHQVAGVSIAVIDHDEIVWARGYGVQHGGRSEPVATQMLFQAASISKPVTAIALIRLATTTAIARLVTFHPYPAARAALARLT